MRQPGDMARQRRRALARQRLYDAVKTLRDGAPASLTLRRDDHYVTYDAVPWTDHSGTVVYIRRGFVGIGIISCKDDWTVIKRGHGAAEYGAEVVGQGVGERRVECVPKEASRANP